ncbi:MAG: response regulator transcription factor [Streptococcaceae bacterium]|jgi:DNA-binding NarL/FixJ family response regulator|nr:response regulator transcription factor [Streptococcaceae bacterium]
MEKIKLILVDDDLLIRKSLAMVFKRESDIEVLGDAADGNEALRLIEKEKPTIVLMDINMPGVDGIAATRLIKGQFPDIKILMLTTFADKSNIQQALAAGADGYLVKTDKIVDLPIKLRAATLGVGILEPQVLNALTQKENEALNQLTPRERDITRLVAQGMKNKEIAGTLFLSEGTIRNNLVVIMEKMGVENRSQLGLAYFE